MQITVTSFVLGARWPGGATLDSESKVPEFVFDPHSWGHVRLIQDTLSPHSTGQYPGNGDSVPTCPKKMLTEMLNLNANIKVIVM